MPSKSLSKAKEQGVAEKLNVLRGTTASKDQKLLILKAHLSNNSAVLLEHYQNGRFDDAEKLAVSILNEFPQHQFAGKYWAVIGQTGRSNEADRC